MTKRTQAPIPYERIRRPYQTARAIGALFFAGLSIAAMTLDVPNASILLALAVTAAIDASFRRSTGDTAFVSLVIDTTLIGAAFLLRTEATFTVVGAFAYLVTASMLILPLGRAALVLIYAITWGAFDFTVGRNVASAPVIAESRLLDVTGMTFFMILIAVLLFAATRILQQVQATHDQALATERRASELKNEFVSMVSHELRTPLTSIAGFTDTLREAWKDLEPDEIEEFLLIMRNEASHLSNLVEDILVIPRLEAGRLRLNAEDFDLRDEAYQTAELIFPPGGPKEASVAIPGGVVVRADRIRIRQVLRNLLENAAKYGGDQILIEGEAFGDAYKVIVSDNGRGIPDGADERIFEQFEQVSKGDARTQQGIGLGLPIARKMVRAMGGELWHEPHFPTGAKFCFTVKIATATPGAAAIAHDRPVFDDHRLGPPTRDSVPSTGSH